MYICCISESTAFSSNFSREMPSQFCAVAWAYFMAQNSADFIGESRRVFKARRVESLDHELGECCTAIPQIQKVGVMKIDTSEIYHAYPLKELANFTHIQNFSHRFLARNSSSKSARITSCKWDHPHLEHVIYSVYNQ